MHNDIQKASLWKRIAAGILDLILLAVLATGFCSALSWILDYDSHLAQVDAVYAQYNERFDLQADMTQDKWEQMSPQEREAYEANEDAANDALEQDPESLRILSMAMVMSLVIATGGILIPIVLLEFVLPLIFGNGQTVGMKVFSLCLMRPDGVQINSVQLFTRVILGRFAIEIMIPVCVAIMAWVGTINLFHIVLVFVLLAAQIITIAVTRNNYLLHDLMAGTVVVDFGSQQIFKTTEDLIAHQKRIAAERAARQTY